MFLTIGKTISSYSHHTHGTWSIRYIYIAVSQQFIVHPPDHPPNFFLPPILALWNYIILCTIRSPSTSSFLYILLDVCTFIFLQEASKRERIRRKKYRGNVSFFSFCCEKRKIMLSNLLIFIAEALLFWHVYKYMNNLRRYTYIYLFSW